MAQTHLSLSLQNGKKSRWEELCSTRSFTARRFLQTALFILSLILAKISSPVLFSTETTPKSSPVLFSTENRPRSCNCTFPSKWTAQAGQDKFVFGAIFSKQDRQEICCKGTFVEFGARNGIAHSNTYPYEDSFGWSGLLFEIDPREYVDLIENRPNSKVLLGPVCPSYQENVPLLLSELSGWSGVEGQYEPTREDKKREVVKNTTCYHLATELRNLNMTHVDYMTIDTEGTEQLIIEDFPWNEFNVRVVQIEQLNELTYPAQRGKKDSIIQHMKSVNYTLISVYVVAEDDTDDLIFLRNTDDVFKEHVISR